ncbi:MAG: hypothetical protein HC767_00995 [Akkermansiaceae bacterium]|nr:hypothetical protein [Akkermansiaceae bacterium]
MTDAARLSEQYKQAEEKILGSQELVETNKSLQQEVSQLKRQQHWDQLKAREDVFCAQQQLEAGRTALKDAISTMETRISALSTQVQVSCLLFLARLRCSAGMVAMAVTECTLQHKKLHGQGYTGNRL